MITDIKDSVNQQFSQVAANYRTSTVHAKGEDLAQMVVAANLQGHEQTLDAGCGAGHTALTFAPHVKEVIAIDLSTAMLGQCRALAETRGIHNVEFQEGDVEQLAFDDQRFDLVVSRYSAHHWPHPQAALAEFHRVLRPGGQLILSDVISFDEFTIDTFVQAMELLRDPSHVRDHSQSQWLAMFHETGFQAEAVFNWDLWLGFDTWVERMATPDYAVTMLKRLFDGAPQEVREALKVEEDYSFTFRGGIIRGIKLG